MNKNRLTYFLPVIAGVISVGYFFRDITLWVQQNFFWPMMLFMGGVIASVAVIVVLTWLLTRSRCIRHVRSELEQFRGRLRNTKKTFECMAFNIEDHLPVPDHPELASILRKINSRIVFFDLCALTPEKAFIELRPGNVGNEGKPYNELINCLTRIEEILAHFSEVEKENFEIRFHSVQPTMRYYAFDRKHVLIAPYFSNNYRFESKCYYIPKWNEELQKHYYDAFDAIWEKSSKLSFSDLKDKKEAVERHKTDYLKYVDENA